MQINSNLNLKSVNINYTQSFGTRYPYEDVMQIMSGSYINGRSEEMFYHTVSGILGKDVASTAEGRARDVKNARTFLFITQKNLIPLAKRFRQILDKISINHQRITIDDAQLVVNREIEKYGNRYIDL